MSKSWTFVEHDILALDAARGITYQSFDDFWSRRMEPMQFIAADAQGVFADLRRVMKVRAMEQFALFHQHRLTSSEEAQMLPPIQHPAGVMF